MTLLWALTVLEAKFALMVSTVSTFRLSGSGSWIPRSWKCKFYDLYLQIISIYLFIYLYSYLCLSIYLSIMCLSLSSIYIYQLSNYDIMIYKYIYIYIYLAIQDPQALGISSVENDNGISSYVNEVTSGPLINITRDSFPCLLSASLLSDCS